MKKMRLIDDVSKLIPRKRFMNKEVNPKYYETIKVNGTATEPKELTEEEFKQGKQGIVWMDKTGKLVFKK